MGRGLLVRVRDFILFLFLSLFHNGLEMIVFCCKDMENDLTVQELVRMPTSVVPDFSLKGMTTWGRVVDVYDGDTMTVILPLLGFYYKFKLRLTGIDTCEIKSKIEENKTKAYRARNRVIQLCAPSCPLFRTMEERIPKKEVQEFFSKYPSIIWVKCGEFDKYGRLLCEAFTGPSVHESISTILIREKLAYPYFGDTKMTESEQIKA